MGKILVADDEPGVREALTRLLEAEGHEVVQAEDGKEAVDRARDESPDVILLDNVMPKLNGIEVLRTLRMSRSTRNTPVIMVTVKHRPKDRDAAVRLGVVEYINKPWMPGEIELRVKWALKGSGVVPAVPWDLAEEEGIEATALRTGWDDDGDETVRTRPRAGISPGSGVEIITPDDGGTVETQDGKLRVDVPSGAVPETMALDASPVEIGIPVIPASLRLRMGETIADLTFTDRTGAPIEGVSLTKAAKISIKYGEEDLNERDDQDFKISKLDQSTGDWIGLPTKVDEKSRTSVTNQRGFGEPPRLDNGKILVVDDEETQRSSMERALTGAGYEVFTEERGDKTALRITEERPDVVLLDLSMPIMDGFQVLRQIKGNPLTRGVSIIVLGEEMNRDVYSASMTLGARDLIVKPWHPGDLQLRVHRAFEASRARMKQAERAANRAKTRLRISVNGKERSRSRAGNRNVRPVGNR